MPSTKKKTEPVSAVSKPDDGKYAASTWGSVGGTSDLTVPSGQLCLVRRPGVQGLITAGVLHKIDSLTALVNQKHLKKGSTAENPDIDMASLLKDSKGLEDLMHTVDRVVVHCVVKPELRMTPNDVTRREPGVIYADMVDLMDKMFIFQYVVGGSSDIDSFRGGLDASVGALADVEGVGDSAQ